DANEFQPTEMGYHREAIFYGGESVYPFQYLDFSVKKYSEDNHWLQQNKGFSIEQANAVITSIMKIQEKAMFSHMETLKLLHPDLWTFLPPLILNINQLTENIALEPAIINYVLEAFTFDHKKTNEKFENMSDFNLSGSYPLIKINADEYLLFQYVDLCQALYETPFQWMWDDKNYRKHLSEHRGRFTETICAEKLALVFGKDKVYSNVHIIDPQSKTQNIKGEIDVLVVFADKIIILQAKAKKLTLQAKRGNGEIIKDDFKKAVQDAYDQGVDCAKLYIDSQYKLVDSSMSELKLSRNPNQIYIFCVVLDYYPALFAQTKYFLQLENINSVLPPFVMDVFFLDVMVEFLRTPVWFLSYINRRVNYQEKILAQDELTILAYHLKQNLWIEGAALVYFYEDFKAEIDAAMIVRRMGYRGNPTPDGILTIFQSATVSGFIIQLEKIETSNSIEIALLILTLDYSNVSKLSHNFGKMIELTKDNKPHDFSIILYPAKIGLTFYYCDRESVEVRIFMHDYCGIKKYQTKSNLWFGVCIDPRDNSIRFIIKLDNFWMPSLMLDEEIRLRGYSV
ncbi:MAG: NERD domain-containing protein, partial [Gammaproteobacteria bacterium]|nr:NERD domain-containing protein [Gammaproteobacteria bacterium]